METFKVKLNATEIEMIQDSLEYSLMHREDWYVKEMENGREELQDLVNKLANV